jgi:sugar phosphate isomerase/epimerase
MTMELRLFKTLWGHNGSLAEAIAACRSNHLDGLEGRAPTTAVERREFRTRMADSGLDYIAEVCTAGGYVPDRAAPASEHLESLRRQAAAAAECRPLFLTVIAGCDAWSIAQSVDFFGEAITIAQQHSLTASFETHRSRSLFNPWTTREILQQLPTLKLTCDFSHWCVVCERLIDTEPEVIALCAGRAHHIHARVGYDQGPQVPHPAAPEYQHALAAHEGWWTQIWRSQLVRGVAITTMTPEFGPDGYQHCLPFTGTPVADLVQVNVWMAERQKRRFAELFAAGSESGTGTPSGNPESKKIIALHNFAGML